MRRRLLLALADVLIGAARRLEWHATPEDLDTGDPCSACGHPTKSYLPVCDLQCVELVLMSARLDVVRT